MPGTFLNVQIEWLVHHAQNVEKNDFSDLKTEADRRRRRGPNRLSFVPKEPGRLQRVPSRIPPNFALLSLVTKIRRSIVNLLERRLIPLLFPLYQCR